MKSFSASDAKNRFGHLIDTAQAEPVLVMRRGRDVAIVMSPEKFRRMAEAARGKVNPAVARLHAESTKRWSSVYVALAR
ncbi:type II toxin-antitoxin system Phd/YefM family antitoxin [Neoaquamicrobium sediminum]|uniref:type II toxin-antitoxin system Phd/YefM family antitoxin n=1 Tax=Neoaquamicrobium sediminum TaxID=1849104 RepID=UPI003BABDCC9